MNNNRKSLIDKYIYTFLYQLFIPLLLLWITRFVFYFYNADIIGSIPSSRLLSLAIHGLLFDIVAVTYTNAPFILMRILPFRFIMNRGWRIASMIVYGITNSILLIVNIGDIIFFRFNNGHMQRDMFLSLLDWEMVGITFSYFRHYWWAFFGIALTVLLMLWLANRISIPRIYPGIWRRISIFIIGVAISFICMRGGRLSGRALGIESAATMVKQPAEINILLNTPFCIMRSANYSRELETVSYFSVEQLDALRTSLHTPASTSSPAYLGCELGIVKDKNIVLIILESGSQIWFDSLNVVKDDNPRGLMPFLDSLACRSMALTSTYCTGSRTVEGLASIIGGVPTFGPMNWTATKYAVLTVDTPARLLSTNGYDTHFFMGANHSAFSLGPLAQTMGFDKITGKSDIDEIPTSGNTNKWGFYDHIMATYVADNVSKLKQPFFAAWLTLDLHDPFDIPREWMHIDYPQTNNKIERCVQYTDYALRCFFEAASSQPWYDNTMFIITADHGFRDFNGSKYNGAYIYGHIPFLIYTPDGSIPPGKHSERAMSQFDIPPTLLWLAGYDEPFISVGTNYFDDSKPHYGLQLRGDTWYIASNRYMVNMSYQADKIIGVYDILNDQQMLNPLKEYNVAAVDSMITWFKAFRQDYTTRANTGRLSITNE